MGACLASDKPSKRIVPPAEIEYCIKLDIPEDWTRPSSARSSNHSGSIKTKVNSVRKSFRKRRRSSLGLGLWNSGKHVTSSPCTTYVFSDVKDVHDDCLFQGYDIREKRRYEMQDFGTPEMDFGTTLDFYDKVDFGLSIMDQTTEEPLSY